MTSAPSSRRRITVTQYSRSSNPSATRTTILLPLNFTWAPFRSCHQPSSSAFPIVKHATFLDRVRERAGHPRPVWPLRPRVPGRGLARERRRPPVRSEGNAQRLLCGDGSQVCHLPRSSAPPHVRGRGARRRSGRRAVSRRLLWSLARGRSSASGGLSLRGESCARRRRPEPAEDRKSTRLNSSHANISYAVFCLKKKTSYKNSPYTQPFVQ